MEDVMMKIGLLKVQGWAEWSSLKKRTKCLSEYFNFDAIEIYNGRIPRLHFFDIDVIVYPISSEAL